MILLKRTAEGYCQSQDGASLVAQSVRPLPVMQETQIPSLGREDPLEMGMATSPVFLPGESHGQRNPVCSCPWGCRESQEGCD